MRKITFFILILLGHVFSVVHASDAVEAATSPTNLVILEPTSTDYMLPQSKRHLPVVKLATTPFAAKIKQGFELPFARFILDLDATARATSDPTDSCHRAFADRSILYLSNEDGGYARRGFWFVANDETKPIYCDLLYVDMTVSQQDLDNGGFIEIFAHEMGHVFLRRLLGDIEHAPSSRFHNVFATTDYQTAFDEGFGIYMQTLAAVFADHKGMQKRLQGRLSPTLADQWFSRIDGRQRIFDVMHNRLVFARYSDPESTVEQAYAQEGMSPAYRRQLINGQAMLASEGVLATLFYRFATDPAIGALTPDDANWDTKALAHHQLLFELISTIDLRHETIPPFVQLLNSLLAQNSVLARPAALSFLHTTFAMTADHMLATQLQALIYAGHDGELADFMPLYSTNSKALEQLAEQWHKGEASLIAGLGQPLWLLDEEITIKAAPWSSQQVPLTLNLNMATQHELAMLKFLSAKDIANLLSERAAKGPYTSLADLAARVALTAAQVTELERLAAAHKEAYSEEASAQLQVLVISALHGMHREHDFYSYDDLYAAVEEFAPDYVGVEIRPEDIGQAEAYLNRNYPSEMVTLAQQYADRVFGFDWLGEEIVGKPIPENYWQTLDVKIAERQLDSDAEMLAQQPSELATLQQQQLELIQVADINDMMDGTYGKLCREIDALQFQWLAQTPYEPILRFNERRDEKIGDAIIKELKAHGPGRVALIMGADHRTFAVERLKAEFGDAITIVTKVP